MSTRAAGRRVAEQVAQHKLFAPPVLADAVPRDAVLARMLEARHRVVFLQAPAGHGKSTLLGQAKQHLDAAGELTGWLSFDEADNDITRFFAHLQALLGEIEAQTQVKPPPRDEPPEATRRALRADWLVERLLALDAPVALFLDEFQVLADNAVLSFFKNLLRKVPAGLRLFVGGRSLPELGLARLEVSGQGLVLRSEDLCFARDEVAEFFAANTDLDLSEAEIDAIARRTEGWPAALQLYRLSLGKPEVRASLQSLEAFRPRQLADYLADNVLALQPPDAQRFLLHSALLARLSGPLCDAVLGRRDADKLLAQLEDNGLFLRRIDVEGRWFKYHTLFSSFLADQLRASEPETADALHGRAAAWFADHGMPQDAMHHALAHSDERFAAAVFNNWASELILEGNLMTVERWSMRVPGHELQRHPDLMVKIAWALTFLRRHALLEAQMDMLENNVPGAAVCTDPAVVRSMVAMLRDDLDAAAVIAAQVEVENPDAQGFTAFELGAAANLKGYLALAEGQFEAARDYLGMARAHSERGDASFSWGYSVALIAINHLIRGETEAALAVFERSLAQPSLAVDESMSSAVLAACYVLALYETDRLHEGRALFEQFHDDIADAALLDFLAVGFVAAARIHDAEGEPVRAAHLLDEAEAIGRASKWPRLVAIAGWERVRRALIAGEVEAAEAIAVRLRARPAASGRWLPFAEDAADATIGEIRLAIHRGAEADAIKRIATALNEASSAGRVRRQVKLLILDALAQRRAGSPNLAHRSLRRAVHAAAPAHFLRTFLEEGDELVHLIEEDLASFSDDAILDAASEQIKAFLERILAAAGVRPATPGGPAEVAAPLEPLTERETEILKLLANGVSNKEIARNVFVSENTVKFHLKNIYSKLGVGSRMQAISAARQMHLL